MTDNIHEKTIPEIMEHFRRYDNKVPSWQAGRRLCDEIDRLRDYIRSHPPCMMCEHDAYCDSDDFKSRVCGCREEWDEALASTQESKGGQG